MRSPSRPRKHPLLAILAAFEVSTVLVFGPAPAAASGAATVAAAVEGIAPAWDWPVAPPHRLLRPFEAPPTPYAAGHRGIDVAATPGAPVLASADGVVSFAGVVVDRPVLSVRHSDGLVSSIEPVTAGVSAGDAVTTGQTVGAVAFGGHCDGRCVHFGVRLYGEYLNPLVLLAAIERAVLLPLGR